MNLELIQAFLAALDYESFSEAAKARFVTGPTQSKQIKALEAELGVKLFERGAQGMAPTEAAYALAPRAREIAASMSKLQEEAESRRLGGGRSLSVGISGFDYEFRLTTFAMRRLNERFGTVDVSLNRLDVLEQIEAVRKHECDASIINSAGELSASGVRVIELGKLPALLEVPIDHPFAQRKSVHVSELAGETLIINEEAYVYSSYRHTMNFLADFGVADPRIKHIRNYLDAPIYVACGQGLAFTNRWRTPPVEGIVKVPLEGGRLSSCITLVAAENPANPLVEPFITYAREWAESQPV